MRRLVVQAAHYGRGSIFPVAVLDYRPRWRRRGAGTVPEVAARPGEPGELLVVRWTGSGTGTEAAFDPLGQIVCAAPDDFAPEHLTPLADVLPAGLRVTTVPATALIGPWAERPGATPNWKEHAVNPSESVSEHGLTVSVRHRRNPYAYLLGDKELDELLLDLGMRRAASIWRNHTAGPLDAPRGQYPRAAMGFVLMDSTAGPWVPNTDAVLGVVTIGEDGHRFLPNAAAKAAGHRRLGRNYGEAVLVDPHLCGSAAFRYGHSAEVRGQIAGASSQTPDQDLYEAGQLARDFVDAIHDRHAAWEEHTGPGDWLADDDAPHQEYRDMVTFPS